MHGRQDVIGQDAGWHGPGRIELHVSDLVGEHRRLPIVAPDLRTAVVDDLTITYEESTKRGDVRYDKFVFDIANDPAQSLEVDANLIDALLNRYVHRSDCLCADNAIRVEVMPFLKTNYRRFKFIVKLL